VRQLAAFLVLLALLVLFVFAGEGVSVDDQGAAVHRQGARAVDGVTTPSLVGARLVRAQTAAERFLGAHPHAAA